MANGILLNIDTTKSEFQNPMVQLRQGDGNYQSLSVTVTSNGEPFDLTGWTITFMGTTAGGFKIIDTASVVTNALQGEFTYTPTKAWGQDQGEFKNAYFKFTKADETASGASFRVNVLDAVDLTAEEAKDYISVVDVMIEQVKTDMDTKLTETKQTLADTQSQANTVQTNVNDLNTNVNDLKAQNNNIKTSDNTWTGTNTFNKQIIAPDGVQGPIDNTSLINAPAFQSLQTQVNNSAVGTNMIQMAKTTSGYVNGSGDINHADYTLEIVTDFIEVEPNKTYCMQEEIYLLVGQYLWFSVGIYDGNKNFINRLVVSDDPVTSDGTYFNKITIVTPVNAKYVRASFVTYGYENTRVKLEKGSVATDWCPAPEDVPSNDVQLVHNTGTETVAGDKIFTGNNTFTQNISGNITGNSATATKLQTPRNINGVGFDGTSDINVNAANDSNLVHLAGNETIDGDKTFTGNVSVTGSLDSKQKIYTRTINPVAGFSIIYKRVGNIVSGRFKADLSGDFQLSSNDGYKSPSEYPVNVIVGTGTDAWFTQDNKFHTNAVSQGNFIFITDDPFPTN